VTSLDESRCAAPGRRAGAPPTRPLACFSVDVEEYFHAEVFARSVPRQAWPSFERRAAEPLDWIAETLAATGSRATFFVLGWTLPYLRSRIRALHDAGHEIACHGQHHDHLARLSPHALREDLRISKKALEDAIGAPVRGYRAPTFSVTRRTAWALDEIADAGFEYDSSIYPIRHDRYGVPDAPVDPFLAVAPSGRRVLELPPLTVSLGPLRAPLGGGGYLRLFPAQWFETAMRRRTAAGRVTMLYIHPWELDPGQPRLPAGALSTWRHRVHLDRARDKVRRLLSGASFSTAWEVRQRLAPTLPVFPLAADPGSAAANLR